MSYGAEQLHYILELPFGSPAFLHDVQAPMTFARNPLYAVIHEACYAAGRRDPLVGRARLPRRAARRPDVPHRRARLPLDVRGVRGAAAARRGRRDPRRPRVARPLRPGAAGRNEVPAAAAIYAEDMYVEREFSEQTAAASAACGPGSRTSTSTTACARTGRTSSAGSSTSSKGVPRRRSSSSVTSPGGSAASRARRGLVLGRGRRDRRVDRAERRRQDDRLQRDHAPLPARVG